MPGVPVTPLEVSSAAFVLSCVSLIWQGWTFTRSGPVIRVTNKHVYVPPGMDHFITVEAVNKGRTAATVESWGIELPGDRTLVSTESFPWDSQLPYRLEPHATAQFSIPAAMVEQTVVQHGVPYSAMNPFVKVGGRKVVAKGLAGMA